MKKISIETAEALFNKQNLRKSNTEVEYILQPHLETSEMWLFGNLIARYNYRSEELQLFNCGWFTQTTRDRLTAILHYYNGGYIQQKNFKWYVVVDGKQLSFFEGMTLNKYAEEVA